MVVRGPKIIPGGLPSLPPSLVNRPLKSNPLPRAVVEQNSKAAEMLQDEANRVMMELSHSLNANVTARVTMADDRHVSVEFPKAISDHLSFVGLYLLKKEVVRWFDYAVSKVSGTSLHLRPNLPNIKSPTTVLSRAEIEAVAGFLGRSGDALAAALERVRDLQSRNLPIALPKAVRVEDRYINRPEKTESIVEFLRRRWGPHMEAGLLTRQYLREHDLSAERALDNWTRTKPLPPDVKVLRVKDAYDAATTDIDRVREAMRVTAAAKRRGISPGHD